MESELSIKLKDIGLRAWKMGQGIPVEPKYTTITENGRTYIKINGIHNENS